MNFESFAVILGLLEVSLQSIVHIMKLIGKKKVIPDDLILYETQVPRLKLEEEREKTQKELIKKYGFWIQKPDIKPLLNFEEHLYGLEEVLQLYVFKLLLVDRVSGECSLTSKTNRVGQLLKAGSILFLICVVVSVCFFYSFQQQQSVILGCMHLVVGLLGVAVALWVALVTISQINKIQQWQKKIDLR